MPNRHTNKRLRLLVRQRMAETGESHQKALNALLAEAATPRCGEVDLGVALVAARYFGVPVTLAVFEAAEPVGRPVILRIPSSQGWSGAPMPVPFFNFRLGGWQ